jgi:4-alpha-glucanotransferase
MVSLQFERSANYEEALLRAAAECGIDREYWDIFHKRHEVSLDALKSILHALGWSTENLETIDRERLHRFRQAVQSPLPKTLVLSEADKSVPVTLLAPAHGQISYEIALEDGSTSNGSVEIAQLHHTKQTFVDGENWSTYKLALAAELPLGYHVLRLSVNGQFVAQTHLILCPGRAYLPDRLANGGKTAGFNVALYGLRSGRNWGCGDFTDLHSLIEWARHEVGFSFIGLNPLHALHNRVPYNTSPYLPLSVYYKNLIYIDIERVPEFQASGQAQTLFHSPSVQAEIASLRAAEYVAYQGVDSLKERFLKLLYREFSKPQAHSSPRFQSFEAYCRREGELLHKFALYCALDEILHVQDGNRWTWRDWPLEYQSPESEASSAFALEHAHTIGFYKYVQFVIDEQLCAAQKHAKQTGMEIGLYHDIAVAVDSCGADLWAHGSFYLNGCRVGAPPDDFSPKGQDWGFPPPSPKAHLEDGYQLYRESVRKIMRGGGALRLDHVMRLFRLFWIPADMEAAQGAYVRDRAADLMHILALESVRSRNIVIGEDLGTVTDEIRDMLARFGILSYRLFYFEKHPDGAFKHSYEYPRQALVSSTTHDLPTLVGFWQSRDIEARQAAGLADEAGYYRQLADRHHEKQRMLDVLHQEHLLPADSERNAAHLPALNGDLHNAIVGFLAQVPSMILLLNQEDLTLETEQQNLPGSTAEYPNWQRKMKFSIEDLHSGKGQAYVNMFRDQLTRTGRSSLA